MIKKAVQTLANKLGYEIRRNGIGEDSEVCDIYDHPIKALYKSSWGNRISFHCPLEKCVWYNGLSLSSGGWDPFSALIEEYEEGASKSFDGSILDRYYRTWVPGNPLAAMSRRGAAEGRLAKYPSYVLLYPWQDISVQQRKRQVQQACVKESREHGYTGIDISFGYKLHGPVHPLKGQLEYYRTLKVYASLKEQGYDRRFGDVTGWLLRQEGDYRFVNTGGVHRVAAMKALRFSEVPASTIDPYVVNVEDVDYWPQVLRGLWSRSAARDYVKMLFSFDSLSWSKRNSLA